MQYKKTIILKNGMKCCLRNGVESDGQAVFDIFNLTHRQTDYLLSYSDENSFDVIQESRYLKEKSESENEIQILAVLNNSVVGIAGITAIGTKYKVKHRAELGISVDQEYWRLGIGQALTEACIECARTAGYLQLELSVVAENAGAISMYEKAGFVEYGRNPKGFNSRITGFQEVISMRLEL